MAASVPRGQKCLRSPKSDLTEKKVCTTWQAIHLTSPSLLRGKNQKRDLGCLLPVGLWFLFCGKVVGYTVQRLLVVCFFLFFRIFAGRSEIFLLSLYPELFLGGKGIWQS